MAYIKPAWIERMENDRREREQWLKEVRIRCAAHVKKMNEPYTYERYGLVYTRLDNDLEHNQYFFIWIDHTGSYKRVNVNHKVIHLAELE